MSIALLRDIVHCSSPVPWSERNRRAFDGLFGSPDGRYPKAAAKSVTLRAPDMNPDSGVPFAAYIHPSNPTSGPYSGLSLVIFPVPDEPCLIALVVGTQGLSPDEAILGRPGHARKVQAICSWLNREFGHGKLVAWAKQDPTRTDVISTGSNKKWPAYKSVFDRYGREIYALYAPNSDIAATETALTAFLDLFFEERDYQPIAGSLEHSRNIQAAWFEHLMPRVEVDNVVELLANRRYAILQGPPGTGKTRMALEILCQKYDGRGRSIQFHPNTTYENFVGGLAPATGSGDLGLRFTPTPGFLMDAAGEALRDPGRTYLLHIDEINRADLGKVLGEAIFLLEANSGASRKIDLPFDFGEPFHRTLYLPDNLHILGTMNSADRSIALVDVAVRRRFAFLSMWPRMQVVQQCGCVTMQTAFRDLVAIFIEHAAEDIFPLVPGHSYFLEGDEDRARESLLTNLAPLLDEYLAQGYVGGFAESIRGYLQWLRTL